MAKNTKTTRLETVKLNDGTYALAGYGVGFKCDVEQYATVKEIHIVSGALVVKAPADGFRGQYLKGKKTHRLALEDCFDGASEETLQKLNAPKAAKKRAPAKEAAKESTITKVQKEIERVAAAASDKKGSGAITEGAETIVHKINGATANDCIALAATARNVALDLDSDRQRAALRRQAMVLDKAVELFKAVAEKSEKVVPAKKTAKKFSKKAVKTVKPATTGPVDKAMRADTLIEEFKTNKMLTSEQAADILRLEGTFRRQAAVAALTQVVRVGKAVKISEGGVAVYKAV